MRDKILKVTDTGKGTYYTEEGGEISFIFKTINTDFSAFNCACAFLMLGEKPETVSPDPESIEKLKVICGGESDSFEYYLKNTILKKLFETDHIKFDNEKYNNHPIKPEWIMVFKEQNRDKRVEIEDQLLKDFKCGGWYDLD